MTKHKIAYLTIDDGPSVHMKRKVDFLSKKKIPAIWFCRGDFLEERPSLAIYAIKKGFVISSHAYSHSHFSSLSLKECFHEIRKTDRIIEQLYKKAGVKRPAKFFRFPYGDKGGLKYDEVFEPYGGKGKARKEKLQSFLGKLGYTQPKFNGITYKYYVKAGLLKDVDWYWTYDVLEYSIFMKEHRYFGIDSLNKVYARMDENLPEGCRGLNFKGSEDIILIHDHPESTKIFEPIINKMLAKGIVFKLPKNK